MISQQEKINLLDLCIEQNFTNVRIAKYEQLNHKIKKYKEWLKAGYNADMDWMANNLDRREDVREILAETQSVITLSYNYKSIDNHNSKKGKIARYAWGDDYHNFLPKKLKKLCRKLKNLYPTHNFKYYVDTGPVLERQWAEKSGLGWQGKNSLILNKSHGSYFFIAVIFTTVEIEEDDPVKDMCGECTKCIDACPTNAIIKDKVIDSNKCISYWTIESKKKKFPEEIKKNLKGWAFGCDICQEVCPWNNKRVKPQIEDFVYPRNGETNLNRKQVESFSEVEFKDRFIKSPIKRPKQKGLLRNLIELENG